MMLKSRRVDIEGAELSLVGDVLGVLAHGVPVRALSLAFGGTWGVAV